MVRARVFISCSQKDVVWRDRLLEHLSPLVRSARVDVQDVANIPPGADFREHVEHAIDGARVGVFLVSASFLASDFIQQHELPRILRKHKKGGLVLLPVLVRACAVELVKWLGPKQRLPRDGGPIARNNEAVEDQLLTEVAREIAKLLPAESLVLPGSETETLAPEMGEQVPARAAPQEGYLPTAPCWSDPPRSSAGALQLGTVFHGRYWVSQLIRAGGMGAVYEVLDRTTNNMCALKIMLPHLADDAGFRKRFGHEARVTGGIESDHLVRVSDAGVDDATGIPFIVMELLRGQDLGRLVAERDTVDPSDVVTYLFQAALALDKTHAKGIVHRDLKPDNLFLTRDDNDLPRIKVLDFGIAKLLTSTANASGTLVLGTPLYMAPEQISPREKTIGPHVDIYALGHVAYALLTGEAYWAEELQASGSSLLHLLQCITEGAKEAPGRRALRRRNVALPGPFDHWFFKATAVDFARRFETARGAVAALADALSVIGPTSRAPTIPPASSVPFLPSDPVALERTEIVAPPDGPEGQLAPTLEATTKKVPV